MVKLCVIIRSKDIFDNYNVKEFNKYSIIR